MEAYLYMLQNQLQTQSLHSPPHPPFCYLGKDRGNVKTYMDMYNVRNVAYIFARKTHLNSVVGERV